MDIETMNQRVDEAIQKLIKEKGLASERLTSSQLAEAMSQALHCGDFVKHVRVDSKAQCVTYLPYEREQQLQNEITDLRAACAEVVDKQTCCGTTACEHGEKKCAWRLCKDALGGVE